MTVQEVWIWVWGCELCSQCCSKSCFCYFKIHVLIFEQEGAALGLLSSGSELPCQSFGLICLKKQGHFSVPKAEQNTWALCLSPSQCGLLIPGEKTAYFFVSRVCVAPGSARPWDKRQRSLNWDKKSHESRGIWVGGGRGCLCLCRAALTVPAHTAALQGAGFLAPKNTAGRGELVPGWIQLRSDTEKHGWKQCLSNRNLAISKNFWCGWVVQRQKNKTKMFILHHSP